MRMEALFTDGDTGISYVCSGILLVDGGTCDTPYYSEFLIDEIYEEHFKENGVDLVDVTKKLEGTDLFNKIEKECEIEEL